MSRRLPPLSDCLLAVGCLGVAEAEIWTVDVGGPLPVLSVSLAVGCLAVAYRRTAPLSATAVSLIALMVVSSLVGNEAATTLGWLVVALVMCASCGFHASRPIAGLGIVLGLTGTAIVVEHGFVISEVLFGWVLAGGAWFAGRALGIQAAATRLAKEHAQLIEERTQMLAEAAVAEERLRIAREMHDVVAHSLSVMMLHVGGVRRLLRADQVPQREALTSAESAGREATAEMHRILGVLRDAPGAQPGPAPSLEHLEELLEPARGAGLSVDLRVTGQPRELPQGLGLAAFRIVQEALTNVLRHAQADRVEVHLTYRSDRIDIDVCDDGRGPSRSAVSDGHGLVGMRERAAAYGGTLSSGPGPHGGFAVRASMPFPGGSEAPVPRIPDTAVGQGPA
jgi:signal transduction histidine kinase